MAATLEQIAELVAGNVVGDTGCVITGAGSLEEAGEGQITFAEKGSGLKCVSTTKASAVIVPRSFSHAKVNLIQVDNPRLAFATAIGCLYPVFQAEAGIHPSAVIGNNCSIGEHASIAAGVVLGDGVTLGKGVILHPNVVIGPHVFIGDQTVVHPNTSILTGCRIGRRVIIHSGTVIGSDGFGFVYDQGRYHKMPQIGIVQIDDDVEIGANNTIDRGTLGKTWIKAGVKTDNLVHIAHNVTVGEHSVIVAQVGIAGSTTIGHHAIFAGQAGIGGHLTIGNQVTVGPQCGVAQSLPDKQVVSGTTLAMPHTTWLRLQKVLPDLPALFRKVLMLEKRLSQMDTNPPEPTIKHAE
jgi:UDP-3-O-[3-hydroxymyristoyl] glucosamine N-acyltransferase